MEEHPDVCKDGTEIRVSFYYKQSCRNVYYNLDVSMYENGELIKHGNIKKIIHIKQAPISLSKLGLLLFTN